MTTPSSAAQGPRRRALPGRFVYIVCFAVTAIWLLLDQATKIAAVAAITPGDLLRAGPFDLLLVRNPRAAFGIPGFTGMFLLVTIAVVVLVVRQLRTTDRLALAAAYGLVMGGALGNAVDRVFRDPGFPDGAVVDMLQFAFWRSFPVFNVADIGITVGAFAVVGLLLLVDRDERAAERDRASHRSVRPETTAPRR